MVKLVKLVVIGEIEKKYLIIITINIVLLKNLTIFFAAKLTAS